MTIRQVCLYLNITRFTLRRLGTAMRRVPGQGKDGAKRITAREVSRVIHEATRSATITTTEDDTAMALPQKIYTFAEVAAEIGRTECWLKAHRHEFRHLQFGRGGLRLTDDQRADLLRTYTQEPAEESVSPGLSLDRQRAQRRRSAAQRKAA